MQLYVLDKLAKRSAEYHADIHLRNSIIACVKAFSDAMHIVAKDKIQERKVFYPLQRVDVPQYFLDNQLLMHPPKGPSMWGEWVAKNSMNMWWMIEYAYMFSEERKLRFGIPMSEEYIRLARWIEHGLNRYVPKPPTSFINELPTDISPVQLEKYKLTPVEYYRKQYVALDGKHRMKWTKRDTPIFFFDHLLEKAKNLTNEVKTS